MTISRMQEPRQLYGLGSLVKKITKPIKKIIKSPIGKAALGAAALYGVNRFGVPGTGGFGQGAISRLLSGRGRNLITQASGKASSGGGLGSFVSRILGGAKDFAFANPGKAALIGGGLGLSLLPFFTGDEEEEEIVSDPFSITPSSITDIVAQAKARDPSLRFLPQKQFAQPGFFTAAEGGRAQLAGGGNRITQLLQLLEGTKDPMDRRMIQQEIDMLLGKFAKGGIADLPEVRMLEGGMPEIDYRESGGFVPVGKKEKADDVPAMLSKNEFVMTADAVRGMGDGNVEKGAQKMYDQMRELEGRVV